MPPIFKRLGLAASAALFLMGTAAQATDGVSAQEIHIGMVNAQSGPASALGKGMLQGAKAVFDDVNSRGGVYGRRISLVLGNDSYEPDNTVEETLKMVQQQKVFALFGYVGTPTVNAVIPMIRDMDVPLVGVFSGAMGMRRPLTPQIFNVRASYEDETEALVAHLYGQGARTVGVMYQHDGFGLAVLSGTELALKRRGLSVVATGTFQRNTLAIKGALATLMEAAPDAIVMAGPYAPLSAFVNAAHAEGLKSKLATVSFVGTDELVERVGKQGDGVLISQVVPFPHDDSNGMATECRKLLQKHAGAALGYVNFEGCVSALLLVDALERSGTTPTRRGLMHALESMQAIDLGGMTFTLTPDSHQATNQVFLTQIRDGKVSKIR